MLYIIGYKKDGTPITIELEKLGISYETQIEDLRYEITDLDQTVINLGQLVNRHDGQFAGLLSQIAELDQRVAKLEIVPPVDPPVPPVDPPIGNTYYIATDGLDNNPGSVDKPWKTFESSCKKVSPGDVVFIKDGTYNQSFPLFDVHGNEDNPITFAAVNIGKVILQATKWACIQAYDSAYVILNGIIFKGGDAVYVSKSHHIIFNQCTSMDSVGVGVHFSNLDGPSNYNNFQHGFIINAADEGAYCDCKVNAPLGSTTDYNQFLFNKIQDCGYEAFQNTNEKAGTVVPNHTVFMGNSCTGNGHRRSFSIADVSCGDGLVFDNNELDNNFADACLYFSGGKDAKIRSNKVINNYPSRYSTNVIYVTKSDSPLVTGNQCCGSVIKGNGITLSNCVNPVNEFNTLC